MALLWTIVGCIVGLSFVAIVVLGYVVSLRKPLVPMADLELLRAGRHSGSGNAPTSPRTAPAAAPAAPKKRKSAAAKKRPAKPAKSADAAAAAAETPEEGPTVGAAGVETSDAFGTLDAPAPAAPPAADEEKPKKPQQPTQQPTTTTKAAIVAPTVAAAATDDGGAWTDARKQGAPLAERQRRRIAELELDLRRARAEAAAVAEKLAQQRALAAAAEARLLQLQQQQQQQATVAQQAAVAAAAAAEDGGDALRAMNYVTPSKERLLQRELDQTQCELARERAAAEALRMRCSHLEAAAHASGAADAGHAALERYLLRVAEDSACAERLLREELRRKQPAPAAAAAVVAVAPSPLDPPAAEQELKEARVERDGMARTATHLAELADANATLAARV